MVFAYAAAIFLIIVVSAIFLGRFFAWLVELIARHVLRVDLSLGTFGPFSVHGIKVKLKGGKEITVDKISLQPKWTLPNSERLFTVYLGNVVIVLNNKLVNEAESAQRPFSTSPSSRLHFVSSHKKTVSRIIKKIAKYVGLHMSQLEVQLIGTTFTKDASVSCKILGGVNLLGTLETDILSCSVSVNQLITRLCVPSQEPMPMESSDTLAQLSVSVLIEMSLMPLQGFSLEDVHIHLKSLGVLLNEKLLSKEVEGQEMHSSIPNLTEGGIEADTGPQRISQPEDVMAEICKKLSVVPQSTKLIVDSTNIALLNEENRELTVDVNRVATLLSRDSSSSSSVVPTCSVDLEVSGVSLNGLKSCNLCTLNRLKFVTELSGTSDSVRLSSSISVESLHNSYIHDECSYWLEYFKHRRKVKESIPSYPHATGVSSKKPAVLESLPRGLDVHVAVAVADCSTSLFLSAPSRKDQAVCRAVLTSFTTQLESCQGCTNSRQVCVSTKLENSYVYMDILHSSPDEVSRKQSPPHSLADNPGFLPSSCQHHWGRTLALGSLSVKLNTHLESDQDTLQLKTEGEASSLALEWSRDICQTILHVATKVRELIPQSHGATREPDSKGGSVPSSVSVDGQFRISGINIFYLGGHDGGIDSLMCRVDDVTVKPSGVSRLNLTMCGMKLCRMVGLKEEPYRCCKSLSLHCSFLEIPRLTMSVDKEKPISLSMAEVLVSWDPNLHMALNDRINELAEDGNRFKALFKSQYPAETQGDSVETGVGEIDLKCDVATFKLHVQTSCSTSFGVEFACGMVKLGSSVVMASAEHIDLLFDGHKTIKFEDVTVTRSSEIQELASLRRSFKNLRTPSNVAWVVEVVTTEVHFAYEFDFASSRDQLVNITKMLKALHRKPRDSCYVEPLPPDLWLKFEKVIFQMDDDPFEVRLRDNYALMLDEYEQRREREELLEMRLNEIRKRPGNLLTVKKEEELHLSLKRKSAEIYTKRSKALYDETPMRIALLTWTFENLDLRILADESYHGKENALAMMRELDADSPFPVTGRNFPTLWCRTVKGTLGSHQCCLRDYPQPIFTSEGVRMCGTLLGAEQESAERAKREAVIKIDFPWGDMVVHRSLSALKYYYDLDFDIDKFEMAWGVDIDPAIATVSLGFEYLSKPSVDPSKPLPFFDKVRLLLHGRLHMVMKEWNQYYSATRNPYETTERMEVEWRNVDLEWTNGRIVIDGDFDLHTRTASKYDDRRVLHLPAFRICSEMEWKSLGNPNDHHSVTPCAPDKLPELPPNQAHDSYAAFRSQNLTLNLSLETAMKEKNQEIQDPPTVFMYASTFRWFQKYQAEVLRNVSRPIKRGSLFARPRQKKKTLGRHYREVSLSLKFPDLSVLYWASFTRQRGCELACGNGTLDLVYRLQLRQFSDGLKRRPAADWSPAMWRSEVSDVTCHLYGLEELDGKETQMDEENEVTSIDMEPTKYYLLTAERLQYFRQGTKSDSNKPQAATDGPAPDVEKYNHRVVCYDLRGAWTLTNRKIFFGLFEAYTNAQILKKNLSADALKVTVVDKKSKKDANAEMSPSPISKLRSGSGANLLEKLVMDVEQGTRLVAHTEEGDTGEHSETLLQGALLSGMDDVIEDTWHIELMNSQVLVKGIETTGCVLVAAGSSRILNRLHKPVWSKGELLNKKTWVGKMENMQYFATVNAEDNISLNNIPWLDTSVITGRQEKQTFNIADLADIVGSGESVGGVITRFVGAGTSQEAPQLQRIVARCGCEFYFVSFSSELDPVAEEMAPRVVPPSPQTHNLQVNRQAAVNTFTIRHKLLEMSTNSVQYAMLIDICHNVVLYTEPKKKEATNKLQKLRFRLQLSTSEDQRGPILELQNTVRSHQAEMRRFERELYEMNLMRNEAPDGVDFELTEAIQQLEKEIAERKEVLNSSSTELRLIIQAYKDFQMNMSTPTPEKAPAAEVSKLAEIYFNQASWQLNQEDGQLEIADVTFRNFIYSKTTLTDATVEHRLELGRCHLRNLLPNSIYKDVLSPLDVSGKGHVDRSLMVRIYCRVKPPVGGIEVKEHFEVNVCPLAVRLTHRLYRKIMVFFFPHRANEYEATENEDIDLGFRGRDIEEKDSEFDDIEEYSTLQVHGGSTKSSSLKRSPSSVSTSSTESSESGGSLRLKRSTLSLPSTASTVDASPAPPASPRAKEKKKKSTFYRSLGDYADVMTERASKNNTFIYVKITQVLLCVSYKGEKEKNIVDVHDFNLALPTLEYHSRTWTWLDLLLAMKKDCISVLVSQIVKEKLRIKGATHGADTRESKPNTREEDKARLLFGERQMGQPKKSKKSLFKKLTKYRHKRKNTGLCQPDGAGPEPVDLEDGFPDIADEFELEEAEEEESGEEEELGLKQEEQRQG